MNQPPTEPRATFAEQAPPRPRVLCSGLFGIPRAIKEPAAHAVGPIRGTV